MSLKRVAREVILRLARPKRRKQLKLFVFWGMDSNAAHRDRSWKQYRKHQSKVIS